jgi:hypothetical protein
MSALGDPRDGGGPPARALLPALQTRTIPRQRPRTSTVDHDQSPSTATARGPAENTGLTPAFTRRIRSSSRRRPTTRTFHPFYFARGKHCKTWTAPCRSSDTTTTTRTGIHATDQLPVSTTPYYAHLYPLLLRARNALQDLDRPARARTPRRLPRPGGTELRHVPPHCSRDLGTGTARGRGICPGSRRPRAPRPVRGVGLGLFVMRFPCFSLCDPRLFVNLRL